MERILHIMRAGKNGKKKSVSNSQGRRGERVGEEEEEGEGKEGGERDGERESEERLGRKRRRRRVTWRQTLCIEMQKHRRK